jgi:hypothetical protein
VHPKSFEIFIYDSMKNHSIFKNFYTTSPNIMKPSGCNPSRAFQRYQEHNFKWPGLMDLIVQNKPTYLPS